jgi:hypothetical protein
MKMTRKVGMNIVGLLLSGLPAELPILIGSISQEETFFEGGRGSVAIQENNETELIKAGGV